MADGGDDFGTCLLDWTHATAVMSLAMRAPALHDAVVQQAMAEWVRRAQRCVALVPLMEVDRGLNSEGLPEIVPSDDNAAAIWQVMHLLGGFCRQLCERTLSEGELKRARRAVAAACLCLQPNQHGSPYPVGDSQHSFGWWWSKPRREQELQWLEAIVGDPEASLRLLLTLCGCFHGGNVCWPEILDHLQAHVDYKHRMLERILLLVASLSEMRNVNQEWHYLAWFASCHDPVEPQPFPLGMILARLLLPAGTHSCFQLTGLKDDDARRMVQSMNSALSLTRALPSPSRKTIDAYVYNAGQRHVDAAKKAFYRGFYRKMRLASTTVCFWRHVAAAPDSKAAKAAIARLAAAAAGMPPPSAPPSPPTSEVGEAPPLPDLVAEEEEEEVQLWFGPLPRDQVDADAVFTGNDVIGIGVDLPNHAHPAVLVTEPCQLGLEQRRGQYIATLLQATVLRRQVQLRFLDWADASGVYAPTNIDTTGTQGVPPPVALDAFVDDCSALLSLSPPHGAPPPSAPPSPSASEAGDEPMEVEPPPPTLVTLKPPRTKDYWPLLPAVLRELGVGHPEWTHRRSYVALLLAPLCAGMPSDATLRDVLLRARDADELHDLIACCELDETGVQFPDCDFKDMLLKEEDGEPLLLCWEHGDQDYQIMAMRHMRAHYKYSLAPLKRKLHWHGHDGRWINEMAHLAAVQRDVVSFRLILQKMPKEGMLALDLSGAVRAIGTMWFEGHDNNCVYVLDRWLGPVFDLCIKNATVFERSYRGQTRDTFERVLWHMMHAVDNPERPPDASAHLGTLCHFYEEWMASALCKLWRVLQADLLSFGVFAPEDGLRQLPDDEDDATGPWPQWRESVRCLMRTTVMILRTGFFLKACDDWWKHVGWLMQAVAECCPHGDPILAITTFAGHDGWLEEFDAPHYKHNLRAWKLARILWRVQLQRNRQLCFTEWLDAADVYAPTNIHAGGTQGTLPPVGMDPYLDEFGALAGSPPASAPPSPPMSEVDEDAPMEDVDTADMAPEAAAAPAPVGNGDCILGPTLWPGTYLEWLHDALLHHIFDPLELLRTLETILVGGVQRSAEGEEIRLTIKGPSRAWRDPYNRYHVPTLTTCPQQLGPRTIGFGPEISEAEVARRRSQDPAGFRAFAIRQAKRTVRDMRILSEALLHEWGMHAPMGLSSRPCSFEAIPITAPNGTRTYRRCHGIWHDRKMWPLSSLWRWECIGFRFEMPAHRFLGTSKDIEPCMIAYTGEKRALYDAKQRGRARCLDLRDSTEADELERKARPLWGTKWTDMKHELRMERLRVLEAKRAARRAARLAEMDEDERIAVFAGVVAIQMQMARKRGRGW